MPSTSILLAPIILGALAITSGWHNEPVSLEGREGGGSSVARKAVETPSHPINTATLPTANIGLQFDKTEMEWTFSGGMGRAEFYFNNPDPDPVKFKEYHVSCGCFSTWVELFADGSAEIPYWEGVPSEGLVIRPGTWARLVILIEEDKAGPGSSQTVRIVDTDRRVAFLRISSTLREGGMPRIPTPRVETSDVGEPLTAAALTIAEIPAPGGDLPLGFTSDQSPDAMVSQLLLNGAHELPSLRTITSRTFAMPDGSRVAFISGAPVHYFDTLSDRFESLNMTPTRNKRNQWEVNRSPIRFAFGDETGADVVSARTEHVDVRMTCQSVGIGKADGGLPNLNGGRVGDFQLQDGGLVFIPRQSHSPGSQYILKNGTCKQSIVLDEIPDGIEVEQSYYVQWRITLGPGTRCVPQGGPTQDGRYTGIKLVADNGGDDFIDVSDFMVYDESVDERLEPGIRIYYGPGGQLSLFLEVPGTWLLSEKRHYPVVIDPTWVSWSANCLSHLEYKSAGPICHGSDSYIKDCVAWGWTHRMDTKGSSTRSPIIDFDITSLPSCISIASAIVGTHVTPSSTWNDSGDEDWYRYLPSSCCSTAYGDCISNGNCVDLGLGPNRQSYNNKTCGYSNHGGSGWFPSALVRAMNSGKNRLGFLVHPVSWQALELGYNEDPLLYTLIVAYNPYSCNYDCDVDTATLSFPDTCIGGSYTKTFVVTNASQNACGDTSPCTDVTYTIGDCSPEFLASPTSFTLAAGSSRVVSVRFEPKSWGNKTCSITVNGNGCNETVTATGKGWSGSCTYSCSVPPTHDGGTICVGQSWGTSFDVVNNSTESCTGGSACNSVSYTVSENCSEWQVSPSSFTLAPGSKQKVNVIFTPAATGTRTCNISVTGNGCSKTVQASGTGDSGSCTYSCAVPSTHGGGTTCVGQSIITEFEVCNDSTESCTGGSACNSVSYTVSENCSEWQVSPSSFTLAPGDCETVYVTFTPSAAGTSTCNISVNGNGCSKTVAASGTGSGGCTYSCSVPSTHDGGNACVGQPSITQLVVTNTSTDPCNGPSGCNSATYTVSENCSEWSVSPSTFTLAPGASQAINVTFTPSTTGTRTCNISVNGNGCSKTVQASGTGTNSGCTYDCDVQPTNLVFSQTCVGQSLARQFTVTNTSTENCAGGSSCSSVAYSVAETCAEWSVSPKTFTLAPGKSQVVTATFRPQSAGGGKSCTMVVSGNGCSVAVTASGTGIDDGTCCSYDCDVSVGSMAFGGVKVGGSRQIGFRITNTTQGTGNCSSSYMLYESCSEFSVSPSSFSLPEGGQQLVVVTFSPASKGNKNCQLSITGAGCLKTVALSGTGNRNGGGCLLVLPRGDGPADWLGPALACIAWAIIAAMALRLGRRGRLAEPAF